MKTGIELIAEERQRQIEAGCTPEVDDAYTDGQLAQAASVWADVDNYISRFEKVDGTGSATVLVPRTFRWPWPSSPPVFTPDARIWELQRAGALIVAEIERLQRKQTEMKHRERSANNGPSAGAGH